MESKVIRPQVHDIQKRFFEALDILIESDKIKGLQSFCSDYKLHRPKYSNLRSLAKDGKPGTGNKFIDIDALATILSPLFTFEEKIWLVVQRS